MGLAVKKDNKHSYRDYLTWPDEERWEIIEGKAYDMTPAPVIKHQRISRNLEFMLIRELQNKKSECEVFDAPTDVVFDEHNVVQPDILVVCDRGKITEKNIQGVPDLIIEIISPYTEVKDKREKKNLYERFGLKEYLIVYPNGEYVERYYIPAQKKGIKKKKYGAPEIFNWNEVLKLNFLECSGRVTAPIKINLWEIFEKERE